MHTVQFEQAARLGRGFKYLLAMVEGNNFIIAAVNDQHRALDSQNVVKCRVFQVTQPTHRQPWIEFLADIGNGRE